MGLNRDSPYPVSEIREIGETSDVRASDESESQQEPAVGGHPTVLRMLLEERRWRTSKAFRAQFLRAARELSVQESDVEFRQLDVSDRQYKRWLVGARPREYACRVLEHMLGRSIDELMRPPNETVTPAPTPLLTVPSAPSIEYFGVSAVDGISYLTACVE